MTPPLLRNLQFPPPHLIRTILTTSSLPKQRQSNPRRQPQLPHAPRPQIQHRHTGHRLRRLHRLPLRHELKKLPRRIVSRFRRHQHLERHPRGRGVRVRAEETAEGAAGEYVGGAWGEREGELAEAGGGVDSARGREGRGEGEAGED